MKMNNVDMNKCVSIEEAKQILMIIKRYYPGVFDGLTIEYGDYYCYNEVTNTIYLEHDISVLDEIHCQYIIDHVNKHYGLNLGYDKRSMSMQAFLHELGHAADLTYKKAFGRYEEYMEREAEERFIFDVKKHAYFKMRVEHDELIEEANFNPDLSDEERERMMSEASDIEEEMDKVSAELDYEYRMIITEQAADRFSANMLTGIFRNII